jgi:hypothetical protein
MIDEAKRLRREKSLKNLKPIEKGRSGNPNGRPKGSMNISTIMKKIINDELSLKDPFTKKKVTTTIGTHIAMKIIKKACDGDLRAASELLDRIEGKATQVNVNANSEMSHDDLIALVEKANDAK